MTILQHPSSPVHFDIKAEAAKLVAAYRAAHAPAVFQPLTEDQHQTLDAGEAIDRLMDLHGARRVLDLVTLAAQARGVVVR